MSHKNEVVLCHYLYDPLNTLIRAVSSNEKTTQNFYCKSRLTTQFQGETQCTIFQQNDILLASRRSRSSTTETSLLVTDQKRSILSASRNTLIDSFVYTPYGYRSPQNHLLTVFGFNGELPDLVTGHYLLGNGYRAFNPILMRFNSPDSWSPFGRGGINPYAAFQSDPINKVDPTGHIATSLMVLKAVNRFKSALPQMKKSRVLFQKNKENLEATPLKNKGLEYLDAEIAQFENNVKLDKNVPKMITKLSDLEMLADKNRHFKYIYTDQSELIIGRTDGHGAPPHPVLAQMAKSPNVISAGYIGKRGNSIILSNQTGHYFRSKMDTTGPVMSFLKNLGIEAKLLRDERKHIGIPVFYRG
ncbi:RHS repeat-associated core domain-containing protein [Pseudomonas azerbaijanoccidentalis]